MDNKLRIALYLAKSHPRSFTMHQLSKLLSIPYASFYRTLQQMPELLITENVGNAKIVRLNTNSNTLKSWLTIASEEEKKDFLKPRPLLQKIRQELPDDDIVLLFGSYAKGTQTEQSDIDLFIINETGERTVAFSKHELLFKKKINPVFVTKEEFQRMLVEKDENVGKQALQHHIVLQNPDWFWEVTLNAIR